MTGHGNWDDARAGRPRRPVPSRYPSRDDERSETRLGADVGYARERAVASFGGGSDSGIASSLRTFVRRYGWRAYALPILVVISIAALLSTRTGTSTAAEQQPSAPPVNTAVPAGTTSASTPPAVPPTSRAGASSSGSPSASASSSGTTGAPVAPSSIPLKVDSGTSGNVEPRMITGAALPAGAPYTKHGDGTFRVLKGTSPIVGSSGQLYRYDVEVENGITGVNLRQYSDMVQQVLGDPRSWSGHGVRLQRVDSGAVDFHVTLTSAFTVRQFCGYTIPVETSCYAAAYSAPGVTVNRVVFDVARWVRGAAPYNPDLTAYRTYMINHEDGHALGHEHAHQCLPGGLAPVMMQQTFGLKSATTGKFCAANPWPYPYGVKGTPGAEQPDTDANNEYYIGD